jgi:hypothetical protein
MDFQQAQAGFQWLESQFRSGAMSLQQYQAGLNELRVTDPWGRLWMLQERSGIWHVFSNGAWVAAQPPIQPAAPPPPPPPVAPPASYAAPVMAGAAAYASVSPSGGAAKKEMSVFARYVRGFFIWLGVWIIIAAGAFVFYGSSHSDEFPNLLMGLAAAAGLSGILMLWSFRGSWKGQVVDVKVVSEQTDDGIYEDIRYAFIRQTNGKIRRERAMPTWQQGDWLEKKQGENWVRKL